MDIPSSTQLTKSEFLPLRTLDIETGTPLRPIQVLSLHSRTVISNVAGSFY